MLPFPPSVPGFAVSKPSPPAGMWLHLPFRLASCSGDRNIFQWDVSTGKIICKFRGHDGDVNEVSAKLQATLGSADI